MGIETSEPVINEAAAKLNFTNEGGVGDTFRLLKNICGLWLVQECRRVWNQSGRSWGWEDLNRLSAAAKPLADLEAIWGDGMFTSDRWIEIIYPGV